jgi:hypothetical protein
LYREIYKGYAQARDEGIEVDNTYLEKFKVLVEEISFGVFGPLEVEESEGNITMGHEEGIR